MPDPAGKHISSSTEGNVLVITIKAQRLSDYELANELAAEMLQAMSTIRYRVPY